MGSDFVVAKPFLGAELLCNNVPFFFLEIFIGWGWVSARAEQVV